MSTARNRFPAASPLDRRAGNAPAGTWIEVVWWLVAFALLLGQPCAPERQGTRERTELTGERVGVAPGAMSPR